MNTLTATTLTAAALSSFLLPTSSFSKPNLLVIITDEHNFRTLGCYRETLPRDQALMWGTTVLETPNLDRIAKAGALCERFYATSPVCTPSRGALVTGLYPQNAGVPRNDLPLKNTCVTFAQVLKDNGYATGYAGKWHLDGAARPGWTPKRKFGFDDNLYMYNRGHWKKLEDTPDGPAVAARNAKGAPTYSVAGADEHSFTTDFLTTKAIDFINKNKDRPFCYMLSIPDPHDPDAVRAPYNTQYKNVAWKLPRTYNATPNGETAAWYAPEKNAGPSQSQYYGMIKCIDDNIGRLLATLEKNNLLDNTIIVFTSDHGDMRAEHHRENKNIPLEASNRVAFLIDYPGKIKPGTRITDTIGNIDFKPTILALMGVKDTSHNEGRDMSAPFLGQKHEGKDIIFTRCEFATGWTAAFSGNYKLIIDNATIWLTDLSKDPDELHNYAYDPAYAPILKNLSAELLTYLETSHDPHLTDTPLGVKFLRDAVAGTLKRLTPAELAAAQKQYPPKHAATAGNDD